MRPVAVLLVLVAIVLAVLLARRHRGSTRDLAKLPRPWGDRPSLYDHVKSHLAPGGVGLTAGGEVLPDEHLSTTAEGIRWAPGALDGVRGHHAGANSETAPSDLVEALREATRVPSAESVGRAYDLLAKERAPEAVDRILEAVLARADLDREGLRSFARWLVTQAPDRSAVKLGLALLGIFRGEEDRELFLTLGRHDEFTLFAAVALENSLSDAEPALFTLARSVDGWGRIQTVERLRTTEDPAIKRWMLREGYRNSVMVEYLAHLCATVGGLRGELEAPEIDAALLDGAGDLLGALFDGQEGPAEGIDDYADGAVATQGYLRHLHQRLADASLEHLQALARIGRFLDEPETHWGARATKGWTPELRREIRVQTAGLIAAPRWRAAAESGLASPDEITFFRADAAAKVLGIDTWERHLERVSAGVAGGSWSELAATRDRERMARVVGLAERLLPLDRIATAPGTGLGLGPQWRPHADLGSVVQELGRFPGLGWNLVRTALRSSVIRNRNMALRALAVWGPQQWPADARPLLIEAQSREPDAEVKKLIDQVLAGKPLDK